MYNIPKKMNVMEGFIQLEKIYEEIEQEREIG